MPNLSPFTAYQRAVDHAAEASDIITNLPDSVPLPEPGEDRSEYMARTDASELVMMHTWLANAYATIASVGAVGLASDRPGLRGRWENVCSNTDEDA